jgi:hypothetical protein
MKLITQEFESLFENYPLYGQDWSKEHLVVTKLFVLGVTWYLLEYDKKSKNAFCYVTWMAVDEFWYVNISELEELKVCNLFEVERDIHFKPTLLKELVKDL